jgi:hypothetical protein
VTTQPSARVLEPFGALISEHRPSKDQGRGYLILVGLSLLGVFLAMAWGLIRWYMAYTQYGPALVWRWSGPSFAVAAALAAVCLAGIILASRSRGIEIRVYENGLVILRGRKGTRIPWGEIESVHTSSVRYGLPGLARRHEVDLVLHFRRVGAGNPAPAPNPRRIRLTHALGGFETLGEELKQRVYPHLVGEYSESFNRGQPVAFGGLKLTAEGVRLKKRLVAWKSFGEVRLDRGVLLVRPKENNGGAIRIAAHRIPNVELCVQLIQYLSQRA